MNAFFDLSKFGERRHNNEWQLIKCNHFENILPRIKSNVPRMLKWICFFVCVRLYKLYRRFLLVCLSLTCLVIHYDQRETETQINWTNTHTYNESMDIPFIWEIVLKKGIILYTKHRTNLNVTTMSTYFAFHRINKKHKINKIYFSKYIAHSLVICDHVDSIRMRIN